MNHFTLVYYEEDNRQGNLKGGCRMTKRDRMRIKIDRDKEMRTEEISKMIDEGGLGADKYYEIEKESLTDENETTC